MDAIISQDPEMFGVMKCSLFSETINIEKWKYGTQMNMQMRRIFTDKKLKIKKQIYKTT